MKTKNIFKVLAFAMLMPAMMLTTACSNQDDVVNNTAENTVTNKGYALPVTVSATRGGDATRSTFDGSKLNFSTGDKLFVYGSATAAGSFAGELTWQSGGTFSGTIYTQKEWTGAADALFTAANEVTATLLPNGYAANSSNSFLSIDNKNTTEAYDDRLTVSGSYAFVASETAKATGVEQLSLEQASTYSSAFALSPGNAILNFTITGLEAGAKDVLLHIHHGFDYDVFGSVTPNASGDATFAIGVPVGANIKEMSNNLTVGTHNFTLPSSTKFAAGKIYNITRSAAIPGALNGQFSVSNSKKVVFSPGNLQLYGANNWKFADHQWDYFGNSQSENHRDLFGWGTGNNPNQTSNNNGDYGTFTNWGNNSYLQAQLGSGWYTLSQEEWAYLFNTRTNAAAKYGYATVNSVHGIIILPDVFTDPNKNNGSNAFVGPTTTGWDANVYTSENWAYMEAAGCVFLPAAGNRNQDNVLNVDSHGGYWSSTDQGDNIAYVVSFYSDNLSADSKDFRSDGQSVRLVRSAE